MENISIQDLVDLINGLKRNGDLDGARNILVQTISYLETSYNPNDVIPPWYYKQLSIVLKKQGFKDESIRVKQLYDEIVVRNFMIGEERIKKEPESIQKMYWPNGPVITKKVIESAKRLLRTKPDLVNSAGLLDAKGNLISHTLTEFDLQKRNRLSIG